MAISKELLEILVLPPWTKAEARAEAEPGRPEMCAVASGFTPFADDIPVMLVDEARIED